MSSPNKSDGIGVGDVICYCFHSAYLGGAEYHLFRHAMLAKRHGFRIIVTFPTPYSSFDLKMQQLCQENQIEIVYVTYRNYIDPYSIDCERAQRESEGFKELIEKYNIKLIHTTTFIPAAQVSANEADIPLISSLYACKETGNLVHKNYLPRYVHSDSAMFADYWSDVI